MSIIFERFLEIHGYHTLGMIKLHIGIIDFILPYRLPANKSFFGDLGYLSAYTTKIIKHKNNGGETT